MKMKSETGPDLLVCNNKSVLEEKVTKGWCASTLKNQLKKAIKAGCCDC